MHLLILPNLILVHWGGAYRAPPDPLAGFKGPTLKERGGEDKGQGGKRKGEGGRAWKF